MIARTDIRPLNGKFTSKVCTKQRHRLSPRPRTRFNHTPGYQPLSGDCAVLFSRVAKRMTELHLGNETPGLS